MTINAPSTSNTSEQGVPGLVSVIIPTYNRAYILGKCIESVLKQTYRSVEIIVVDDGSADNTRQVAQSFGAPVRYIYQQNAGVNPARNHGLRESRGEFVAFLDSDDEWLPWKLAAQVELMRKFPNVGMIWTDMAAVNAQRNIVCPAYIRKMYSNYKRTCIEDLCNLGGTAGELCEDLPAEISNRPFYYGDIFSQMVLGCLVHTSTVLIRRTRWKQVGEFDESFARSGGDGDFHIHTCFYGPVGFLDGSSTFYRVGDEDQIGASRNRLNTARNSLAILQKWLTRGKGRYSLSSSEIRRCVAECYEWIAWEKYLAGDFWGARAAQLQSLGFWPWQPRLWLHFAYHLLPGVVRRQVRTMRDWVRATAPARAEEGQS